MFNELLHQRRFPLFTVLSALTTLGALIYTLPLAIDLYQANASLDPVSCYQRGLFCLPGIFDLILYLLGGVGLALSIVWGLCAHFRGEHRSGRIALAGIALQLAPLIVYDAASAHLGNRRADVMDRYFKAAANPKTWVTRDVLVQPDGKLLLLGPGLVRLLPDGQQDPSFQRDYSFVRGGSLPDPVRQGWPEGACAAMAPNGDLILAAGGWIGRVRPDGSEAPGLLKRPDGGACWGLAVQPDGKVLAAWYSQSKIPVSRLLPDGSVDPGFHSAFTPAPGQHLGPWPSLERITVLRDGRILLAGPTQPVDGGCTRALLRLNADGSLDSGFQSEESCQPSSVAQRYVPDLAAILPDGSMLLRMTNGAHTKNEAVCSDRDGKPIERPGLLRFLNRPEVTAVLPLSDGKILVGDFGGVARVRPDGTPDQAFHPAHIGSGARKILLQGGRILILDGNGRLIRLNADGNRDPGFHMPALQVYSN